MNKITDYPTLHVKKGELWKSVPMVDFPMMDTNPQLVHLHKKTEINWFTNFEKENNKPQFSSINSSL